MNLFSRVPEWLRGALGTTQPQLPHELETNSVQAFVDIMQQGHGYASWRMIGRSLSPADVLADPVLVDPFTGAFDASTVNMSTARTTRTLWELSVAWGLGATRSARLVLSGPNSNDQVRVVDLPLTAPSGSLFSIDLLPRRVVVPPEWRAFIRIPGGNLAAGEVIEVRAVQVDSPAGTAPR